MPGKKEIEQEFIARIRKHQGILHKISTVYANSKLDQEDLKQEMILQLWKSYPGFKGKAEFPTWMYRVALNTALTFTKKASFFGRHAENMPAVADDSAASLEHSEELKLLYQAIAQLKEGEKAIILLWLEEKSYQEIADMVGISLKNVSVRIVRIKAKLADLIERLQ